MDAYVDWRQHGLTVREAYERWTGARVPDAGSAYLAYRAALDREERAAHRYAGLVTGSAAPRVPVSPNRKSDQRARP
jgi:hypothetical protein